jgi:curved DNA-binding protein CbpA
MKDNYYDILGVDNFSSFEEIKKKYKELVKCTHPDKGGNSELFQQIKIAYENLKNLNYKNDFDRILKCKINRYISFNR